jgi:hypothetical protein
MSEVDVLSESVRTQVEEIVDIACSGQGRDIDRGCSLCQTQGDIRPRARLLS